MLLITCYSKCLSRICFAPSRSHETEQNFLIPNKPYPTRPNLLGHPERVGTQRARVRLPALGEIEKPTFTISETRVLAFRIEPEGFLKNLIKISKIRKFIKS